jgi:glycosyltransferase involved in cell wall biosynthesis
MTGITVCIPSIPERGELRSRAFASVCAQTLQPHEIMVLIDHHYDGEIATRNALLEMVQTPWIAWLDDDDEMMPHHLETLYEMSYGVDLVYSDYETVGSDYKANFIEPAYLCKTKTLRAVGGFLEPEGDDWPYRYGDWGTLAKLLNIGYSFKHSQTVTWLKHIHDTNICGTGFEVANLARRS